MLHYTGMASCAEARARLCDPLAEVSAHWLIAENGTVEALVPEDLRAWHAGAGRWRGADDINSGSIGIELANPGDRPFTQPQMAALEVLLVAIMARWHIAPQAVIAHSDMAPGRKIDPGPRFDWRRLARQGLSIWPDAPVSVPVSADGFLALAQAFGYADLGLDTVLAAFRLRFRPSWQGPLDGTDMAMIADLAQRFGTDGGAWRAE